MVVFYARVYVCLSMWAHMCARLHKYTFTWRSVVDIACISRSVYTYILKQGIMLNLETISISLSRQLALAIPDDLHALEF